MTAYQDLLPKSTWNTRRNQDTMKDKKRKLPPQIVGNAGLFYVCHRLSVLGWNVMPSSKQHRSCTNEGWTTISRS
jgi:hypothetical protein